MQARKKLAAAALSSAIVIMTGSAASAHVTANPSNVAAGGYGRVDFRVPHGCEGASTNVVEVKIPNGVVSLKPQSKPGWTVETTMVTTEPYELHGQTMTEQIGVVRWKGGSLPDAQFDDFAISAKFPDTAGTALYFPTVQYCGEKSSSWIEIPTATGQELEHPAPAVLLIAAAPESKPDQAPDSAKTESSDDTGNGTDPLSVIALLLGAAGAVLGGVSLTRRR